MSGCAAARAYQQLSYIRGGSHALLVLPQTVPGTLQRVLPNLEALYVVYGVLRVVYGAT